MKVLSNKIPHASCEIHPEEKYSHFSLSELCHQQVLYSKCLPEHNCFHKVVPLKSIFSIQVAEYKKQVEAYGKNSKILENIFLQLNTLRRRVEDVLNQIETFTLNLSKKYQLQEAEDVQDIKEFLNKYERAKDTKTAEDLKSTLNSYRKLIRNKEFHEIDFGKTYTDFIKAFKSKLNDLENLPAYLEKCIQASKQNFLDLKVQLSETNSNKLHKTGSRGCAIYGNTVTFSYEPIGGTHSRISLSSYANQRRSSSIFKTNHRHPIHSIEFINRKTLITACTKKIIVYEYSGTKEVTPISSYTRAFQKGLIYLKNENLILSVGEIPHCQIIKIVNKKIKPIAAIYSQSSSDQTCNCVTYIPSRSLIVLGFQNKLNIYHLQSRILLQTVSLTIETQLLNYLPKKDYIVIGSKNKQLLVYSFDGNEKIVPTKYSSNFLDHENIKNGRIVSYAFSIVPNSDESQLLVACASDALYVYDFAKNDKQKLYTGFCTPITDIVYDQEKAKVWAEGKSNFMGILGFK